MGEIIPFPAPVVRLRVTPAPLPVESVLAVEHDGAVYPFTILLGRLPESVLDELDALMPRSAQEAWDFVVRRWARIAESAARGP